MSLRLGFVDYKLENFHANVLLRHFRGELAARGVQVTGCWALDAGDGQAWAAKNNVPWCATPAALDATCDAYAILAPSNPELHLELCERILPFGKSTYVDKTFAPDLATARRIFALADRHGAAVQTSSALRYTNIQATLAEMGGPAALRHMVAWGSGKTFGEYAIHPTELVVSCMGPEATRLLRRGAGDAAQLVVDFSGGRTAVINVYCGTNTPFAASLTTTETRLATVTNDIFRDTAAALLDFFAAGRAVIPRAESLAIRAILDAAADPRAGDGWVPLG